MPPKPSKKSEAKAKQKIIEDKTFGLKNKNKSAKVGKYIQQVEAAVKSGGNRKLQKEAEENKLAREKKKQEEAKKAEIAALFKPVVTQQKVPLGVDPKTVVCVYFKAGQCTKGDKCKFSHDLGVERKAAKINLYADLRDGTSSATAANGQTDDTMDKWDQNKLEQVVLKKHGPGIRTTTDIVCKYFLDAIEQHKYGWFWECPNGGDQCKYRHALPPGFVLKEQGKNKEPEEKDEISLEEFLETERYRIHKETPVTAESFARWKEERRRKQEAEEKARQKAKEADYRAGKLNVSGRDLFAYQPDLFRDDDEAMEVDYTTREEGEESSRTADYQNNDDQEAIDETIFLQEDFENLQVDQEDDEAVSEREDDEEDHQEQETNDAD